MIKIFKDNNELEVSKNAYEMMYKRLGYKIADKKVSISEPLTTKKESNKDNK